MLVADPAPMDNNEPEAQPFQQSVTEKKGIDEMQSLAGLYEEGNEPQSDSKPEEIGNLMPEEEMKDAKS